MRYPASEKLEIIRLVEQSHLPVRRTLANIGIPRSTFYRWCDQYQTGGPEALDDRSPRPDRVWNRIPDQVRERIVTLALDQSELSPRELAVRFTDAERYFVSEASVYRLLKAYGLLSVVANPRAFRVAQEPLHVLRCNSAAYARDHASCYFSLTLIANLERHWIASNRI